MALSIKDTTGRGTASDLFVSSEDGSLPGPGTGPGNVELAKLGDMLKSLKDEYTRASSTLSEMGSVFETCSGRLGDWYQLIERINGVFDSLNEPSSGSVREEQQKAAEIRLWSIVTGGVCSLGLSHTVFGGDDDGGLAEKLGKFGMRPTVDNEDGESTRTRQKRIRETDSDKLGEKTKEDGPFSVPRGSY